MKGAGGRPKIPAKIQAMRGNPGHRTLKKDIDPPVGDISCPEWINPTGKKEWRRVSAALERLGLLTEIDLQALAAYCNAYSELMAANQRIKRSGRYVMARKMWITAPWVNQANKSRDAMVKYAAQFGCTPSARRGLEVKPMKSTDDEVAKVLDME